MKIRMPKKREQDDDYDDEELKPLKKLKKLKKVLEVRFEPSTSGFQVQCSTKWATKSDMRKGGILLTL